MIEEEAYRRARLDKTRELGVDPYPIQATRTHTIDRVLDLFDNLLKAKEVLTIVGRIRGLRKHGGLTFLQVEDAHGKMQVALKKDEIGSELYEQFQEVFDVGDFIQCEGTLFRTKTDEQTLMTTKYRMLTKALLPLPEKWHGLSDTEIRYRKRYLDLIANPSVRHNFVLRSKMIQLLREFMHERKFMEVETPILQHLPGGALAKPFKTHHNALDADLYLRVAPELYLKRLIVGGYERVFEIARCFRNEGIDNEHNPEFTQIEFYWAYADYNDIMSFMEELIPYLLEGMGLDLKVKVGDQTADFTPPYPRVTMRELIKKYAKLDIEKYQDTEKLYKKAVKMGVEDIKPTDGRGKLIDEIYKTFARPKIMDPIFMIDHPVELSPLTKRKPDDPRYVERMQIVCAGGNELCNAFTELNDPIDQEERFQEQEELRVAGDEEAQRFDQDFIDALKHGMPPTGGIGIGLDRLFKTLVGAPNLKEVILFPTLRPEKPANDSSTLKDEDDFEEITGKIPDRKDALKLLKKHIKEDNLVKHHLAAEMVMQAFAKHFKKNKGLWGITGLLHDIDWNETKDRAEEHGLISAEILEKEGIDCRIVYAIKAHNEEHGLPMNLLLDRVLFCVEELTGLITATALVQKDKKLASVSVASVQKKFKKKEFAKNVDRKIISRCEELIDLPLEKVIEISLKAMQKGAKDLGL